MRNILLKGMCKGGHYLLPTSSLVKVAFEANKIACGVVKPSLDRWHSRLGHASIPRVQCVIRDSNLPCLVQEIKDLVCNALTARQESSTTISYLHKCV
jgi:hypothetical protein